MTTSHSENPGFKAAKDLLEFLLERTGATEVTVHMKQTKTVAGRKSKKAYRLGFWWIEGNHRWQWFHQLDDQMIEKIEGEESHRGFVRYLCAMANQSWEEHKKSSDALRKLSRNQNEPQ